MRVLAPGLDVDCRGWVAAHGTPRFVHPSARIGGPPEHVACIQMGVPAAFDVILGDQAWVNAFVTIDQGLERPTMIGDRSIVLAHAHVGHDAQVGDDCTLATGSIIGGHATVGDRVKVGLGAVVLPCRTIGDDAVIGAGTVVTLDVPAGATVVGNPARILRDGERNAVPHTERDGWARSL